MWVFCSSTGGLKLFSHSLMIAEAVRLRLLGVKLFKSGHGKSPRFGVEDMVWVGCGACGNLGGLLYVVSKG